MAHKMMAAGAAVNLRFGFRRLRPAAVFMIERVSK